MARNKARPGRTVVVFFLGLAVAYGLVAAIGTWKPALGLDLEGGTQIILTAKGTVSKDNLNEAEDEVERRRWLFAHEAENQHRSARALAARLSKRRIVTAPPQEGGPV